MGLAPHPQTPSHTCRAEMQPPCLTRARELALGVKTEQTLVQLLQKIFQSDDYVKRRIMFLFIEGMDPEQALRNQEPTTGRSF